MSNEAHGDPNGEMGVFRSPLEQIGSGRRETFHRLESRPDLFIRRREIRRPDTEYSQWSAEQFEKLRNLGVKVPNFRTVIGEDARGKAEFLVVDKVLGEPLDSLVEAKADLPKDAVNRTFKGILTYLREGQLNDESVFWDFATRQFMYGHTAAEIEDDIYLVDVDPTFRKIDGEVLGRVEDMMTSLHELVPIENESWGLMYELIITNDTGKVTEEQMKATRAWLEENLPPRPHEVPSRDDALDL